MGRYDTAKPRRLKVMHPSPTLTTRLAPSPTGALHLGNARTFLITWAMARKAGMRIILRMEDLDGPRIKTGADAQAISDLTWLGINWDNTDIRYQRADLSRYIHAMKTLASKRLVYPCACTRKEIQSAQSAPHASDHELRYPGTCRCRLGTLAFTGQEPGTDNWRMIVPDEPVAVDDAFAGMHTFNIQHSVGDMIVWTKAGLPSYQLAVVVDDFDQGVTDVIRGDDLLDSGARQTLIYQALGLGRVPRWHHLPLVLGPDGKRLAKRHGDTRVAWYREQGVSAEKVIGLIAWWSGAQPGRAPMSAIDFADRFDIQKLSRTPCTFTPEDHQWLLSP
jgi:glutamyl-tRNA synthetase